MFKTAITVEQIGKEIADFLSQYIKVDKLILFGSYKEGNARQDSDFDIAVISENLEKMTVLKKMELFSKVCLVVDSRVELKGFGQNEFLNSEKGSFMEMIKEEGRIIYLADKNKYRNT